MSAGSALGSRASRIWSAATADTRRLSWTLERATEPACGRSSTPVLGGIAIEPGLDARVPADARLEARASLEALKAEGIEPDVVLSTQTFEHLLSPRVMACSALETMGEAGLLVVEVPYDLLRMNFMLDPGAPVFVEHSEHLNFFTSDSLARMASSWGYEVVEVLVGAQIHKYGGLIPSITLVAQPSGSIARTRSEERQAAPESLANTLDRDRPVVRRAQRRLRALGILARRGRW